MALIKKIHSTNSISDFYINEDKKRIREVKSLAYGRIKEYNVNDSDI